jgi:hypothetical protein
MDTLRMHIEGELQTISWKPNIIGSSSVGTVTT